MKQIIFLIIFAHVCACYGQNNANDTVNSNKTTILKMKKMKITRPILTDTFEILDIKKYEELGTLTDEIAYDENAKEYKLFKGTSLHYDIHKNGVKYSLFGSNTGGYTSREIADDSYFYVVKGYYPNGKIAIKVIIFNGCGFEFRVGRAYRFHKDGYLNYAPDLDSHYEFTFEQVLEYLLTEEKLPLQTGWTKNRGFHVREIERLREKDKVLWQIVWINPTDYTNEITLTLDGKTGEVVSRVEKVVQHPYE
jgi:hypothetical protein